MDESDNIHHPDHYSALLDKLVERGWISAVARNAAGEFVFEWTPKGRDLAWHLKVISQDLPLDSQAFDSFRVFCEMYALPPRR